MGTGINYFWEEMDFYFVMEDTLPTTGDRVYWFYGDVFPQNLMAKYGEMERIFNNLESLYAFHNFHYRSGNKGILVCEIASG